MEGGREGVEGGREGHKGRVKEEGQEPTPIVKRGRPMTLQPPQLSSTAVIPIPSSCELTSYGGEENEGHEDVGVPV